MGWVVGLQRVSISDPFVDSKVFYFRDDVWSLVTSSIDIWHLLFFYVFCCVQILVWWESLTLREKRVPANKTKLVKMTETIIQAQATVFQGGGSGGGDEDEEGKEEK